MMNTISNEVNGGKDTKTSNIGRVVGGDRLAVVYVHDDAQMAVPVPGWQYDLIWKRPEPDRGTKCDDRMLAASLIDSYLYLVCHCTKEEAWRRIKIIRAGYKSLVAKQARPNV